MHWIEGGGRTRGAGWVIWKAASRNLRRRGEESLEISTETRQKGKRLSPLGRGGRCLFRWSSRNLRMRSHAGTKGVPGLDLVRNHHPEAHSERKWLLRRIVYC
jgi:hypothetical protein